MIRGFYATLLPRSGLLLLPGKHALLFVPAHMRAPLGPPLQRCDGAVLTTVLRDAEPRVILEVYWRRDDAGMLTVMAAPAAAPGADAFARVPTLPLARLQRRWRAALRSRRQARREVRRAALAMAFHPRLGAASPLASLTLDALRLVAARV